MSGIKVDYNILNQKATPSFYADTLANRPAAGYVGRIFVSTDTFAFYRDNGTGWDLIGGPGTGTITGTGASGQIALWNGASTITGDTGLTYDGTANSLTASKFIVTGGTSSQFLKGDGSLDNTTYNTGSGSASQVAFFNGANSITGENNLWWDSVNNHFGINTNTPGTALDIHHDQSTLVQLNQTTATNDTRIAFQNSGTALWRIGSFYNAGANDWGIYDVVGSIQPLTIKNTTGQTFIGPQTSSSGRLVVNNATGDDHIVVLGANSPSIRVRNNGSTPFYQFGLGLSTALNNFIQGSFIGDFCIFNNSLIGTKQILFGIYNSGSGNTEEAVRIAQSKNVLIGTTTDAGFKIDVSGTSRFTDSTLNNPSGATLNITTNGNNGTSGSPLPTTLNFRGFSDNINGQILVNDVSGSAQVGVMQFYTYNFGQVLTMTLKNSGIVNITNTPVYATNALAIAGGLAVGDIYKSATGVLSIVF